MMPFPLGKDLRKVKESLKPQANQGMSDVELIAILFEVRLNWRLEFKTDLTTTKHTKSTKTEQ